MKKRICLLVVCVLALLIATTSFAAELNPVGTYPITNEPITLTILMSQDVLVEDYETNLFTKWIEETCNVNLDFELLPAGSDGMDKLSIMLSSGQKLPDIINVTTSVLDDYIYGQAGLFIDLTDMYSTQAYYIPQRLAEYPTIDVLTPITAADGKIYSIPMYMHETIGDTYRRMWANTEFLKVLDLEIPTTTQEFYDCLVAIRDKDPNGNGKKDEIPLIAADTNYLLGYLMNAFLYTSPSKDYLWVDNGKLGVSYTEDAFQEGLRFMRKLSDEGLLSPLTFTQTTDQLKQTASGDGETATVGFVIQFSTSLTFNNYATSPLTPQYAAIPPLAGPEGVSFAEFTPAVSSSRWHITKYCEHPEAAFRVGDLIFSREAFLRNRFGVEGVNWRFLTPEDNLPSYFEGRKALIENAKPVFMELNNVMWRNSAPVFTQDDLDLRVWNGDPVNATYTCALSTPDYLARIPEEYVLALNFTPDEAEEVNEIQTTLRNYVRESIARFITGDLDVENDWASFQRELKNIGLDKYLEISQAAYDRTKE